MLALLRTPEGIGKFQLQHGGFEVLFLYRVGSSILQYLPLTLLQILRGLQTVDGRSDLRLRFSGDGYSLYESQGAMLGDAGHKSGKRGVPGAL